MITNTHPRIAECWPQLRDALVEAGYSEGGIRDRLALPAVMAALEQTHRGHLPQGLRLHPDHEIESIGKITDGKIVLREPVPLLHPRNPLRGELRPTTAAGDQVRNRCVMPRTGRCHG